jgi:LPS O-antigen subunit length determinant protein (WzzB/FepE family)
MTRVQLSTSSHASRHPTKQIQKTRKRVGRPTGKLTPGQQASRALTTAQRKVKQRNLEEDVDAYCEYTDAFIQKLMAKHNQTRDYIKATLTNATVYKRSRAVNIHNAIKYVTLKGIEREPHFTFFSSS